MRLIHKLCPPAVSARTMSNNQSSENQVDMQKGKWSDEEQALFTEAYDSFGSDWDKVADAVRTRSKIQCRTHHQLSLEAQAE